MCTLVPSPFLNFGTGNLGCGRGAVQDGYTHQSGLPTMRRTACRKNSLFMKMEGGVFGCIKISGKLHRS